MYKCNKFLRTLFIIGGISFAIHNLAQPLMIKNANAGEDGLTWTDPPDRKPSWRVGLCGPSVSEEWFNTRTPVLCPCYYKMMLCWTGFALSEAANLDGWYRASEVGHYGAMQTGWLIQAACIPCRIKCDTFVARKIGRASCLVTEPDESKRYHMCTSWYCVGLGTVAMAAGGGFIALLNTYTSLSALGALPAIGCVGGWCAAYYGTLAMCAMKNARLPGQQPPGETDRIAGARK
jgi:hypothetical protein